MKRYVIIGNGVAAAGCIEGIRSTDTEGEITVISAEKHEVYCRPLISYYLEGKTDLTRMNYRGEDFYTKNEVRVIYGESATAINPDEHTVTVSDGSVLPYDAVCVAAGSSPFVPPMEGLDTVEKKFSFLTLDDALALEQAITPESRVLIVGAGLIGLKCAEGIQERVASITVCDLANRVLSSILDDECAALMQRKLEEHGISFLLGDSVAKFERVAGVEGSAEGEGAFFGSYVAHMKSGAEAPFDVLVLAVGVRANIGLVKAIGGNVNRGIVVDDRMATSIPGIYAAGDCAEGYDVTIGANRVLAIFPNAYMQGHAAGVNMAGGEELFDCGMPMNSIGFFGLHAMTAGAYEGECYEETTPESIKRLYVKDDLLKGFLLIGCHERAGIYTSLIRNRTPLSEIDFELMKQGATTAAFSSENRRKKFGGVV
ncbi:MAG: NAD(P)/FAD-dependent oxidoreductase [Lachnospiraceae bacterium]|nr:NAD(P)/FAD-dependent oxidoreductase [Lachnospiraceae bacterium]